MNVAPGTAFGELACVDVCHIHSADKANLSIDDDNLAMSPEVRQAMAHDAK